MKEEYYTLWGKLKLLPAYQNSFQLGEIVWSMAVQWGILAQRTIGEQLIRAVDSIAANIAEGYGRYNYKDKIKFYYYARGSYLEAYNWLAKAQKRNLIPEEKNQEIKALMEKISKDLQILISNTRRQIT